MLSNREIVKLSNTYMRMKQTYCFFSTFAHRVLTAASVRTKLLTAIALCLFSIGNVWAKDVTINYTVYSGKGGASGTGGSATATIDDITITSTKAYYDGRHVREYKSGNIIISAQGTITKIVVTGTTGDYAKAFGSGGCSAGTWNNVTWTGNSNSVVFTTGAQARWTKIVVTYEPASSYKVTAVAYPTGGGSVSVEGNKITATPNTGWQISTTEPYTVSGTATVAQSGNEFTVTPSSNCTVQINFEKEQTYTLTYYEGNTSTEIEVAEGANILEALKDITPTSCDATSTTFIGWTTKPINGKQSTRPELIADDATIIRDMPVYAVFANGETTSGGSAEESLIQTLQYDTWTYGGSTTDKTTYRLFHTDSYVESAEFDLSTLSKVVVYGGTFGGTQYNTLTIAGVVGGTTTTWQSVTVSGKKETGTNTYNKDANCTLLSGTGKLRVTSNSGESTGTGVRISKVEIYTLASSTTYTDYMTTCGECEKLEAPTSVTVKDKTATTATITWNAVTNAQKYKVYCSNLGKTYYTEETSFKFENLSPSTEYLVYVMAMGDGTSYCDENNPTTDVEFSTEALKIVTAKANTEEGGTVSVDGYVITATPATGWRIAQTDAYSVTPKDAADVVQDGNKFTVAPSTDCAVQINFERIPTYEVTWLNNNATFATTTVEEGAALVLPEGTPISCDETYSNFVGWFTEAAGTPDDLSKALPGTQVTTATPVTNDISFYAVFSDKSDEGGLTKVTSLSNGDVVYLATSPDGEGVTGYNDNKDATVSTTPSEWMAFTVTDYNAGTFKLKNNNNQYVTVALKSFKLTNDGTVLTFNDKGYFTFVVNEITYSLFTQKDNMGTYYRCYDVRSDPAQYTQFFMYTKGAATGYVSSCCTDPAVVSIVPEATILELNEKGEATTTVACSQKGGGKGEWSYRVFPSETADFDGATFTANAAGTYTLYATYTENCAKTASVTVTVNATPTLSYTSIALSPDGIITFGETDKPRCGGNSLTATKKSFLLKGYNLKAGEKFEIQATDGYKFAISSRTLDDYLSYAYDYVPENGKISKSIYILAFPPAGSEEDYDGTITITYPGAEPISVQLKTTDIICPKYKATFFDRGVNYAEVEGYAGDMINAPATNPEACHEPVDYVFDGWATEQNIDGLTSYTKATFPYEMPKNDIKFYAVYKYKGEGDTSFKPGESGDYQISAKTISDTYYAKGTVSDKQLSSTASETEASSYKITAIPPTKDGGEYLYTIQYGTDYIGWKSSTDLQTTNSLPTDAKNYYWKISEGTHGSWRVTSFASTTTTTRGLVYRSSTGFKAYAVSNVNGTEYYDLEIGKATPTLYTTSPSCGPHISLTGDVRITSAKGVRVDAYTPLELSAINMDKNADNAAVTIKATSDNLAFTIKEWGTTGNGSTTLTLSPTGGLTDATLAKQLCVVYTPIEAGKTETATITVTATRYSGQAEYAKATIQVHGRSLPERFVIATKGANDTWLALPNTLAATSGVVQDAENISDGVDHATEPTKLRVAPSNVIYKATARAEQYKNSSQTGLRFTVDGNQFLQGSENDTPVWLSTNNSEYMQSWTLETNDFVEYTVRLDKAEDGRYLAHSNGRIGNYKATSKIRFLPFDDECICFNAPENLNVVATTSTSITLKWDAVAGAEGYEYSLNADAEDGGTWIPMGNVSEYTIKGLEPNKDYTIAVSASVPEGGKENCSYYQKVEAHTLLCDDAPHNLWASATADAVTIVWEAASPTATVKIYSDENGTTLFKKQESGATENHQCRITGLEQNTKYWYQVFSAGTCGSAIASFTTESKDISIVEWEKQAVIVDINTEIGEGVDLVVQKRSETSDGNVAEDIFFSKYFEAASNVKLLAIYNGTGKDMDVSNVRIHIIRVSRTKDPSDPTGKTETKFPCEHFVQLSKYIPNNIIHSAQEVVLYSYQPYAENGRDNDILECIQQKEGYETWIPIPYRYSETADAILFGGQDVVLLERKDESGEWTPIDLIGAVNETFTDVDATSCTSVEYNSELRPWGWGDGKGWYCADGKDLDGQSLRLSTNRCLLIRDKDAHVVSGKNAVQQNIGDFRTLCTEWKGRHVQFYEATGSGSNRDYTKDNNESCEGFTSVAGFDYNNYYITYEDIQKTFNGKSNENGTYTINVPELPQLACTDIRLQLTKNGEVTASVEQKVPIIVTEDANTTGELFSANGLTPEVCKTCDVVVRDKSRLTHATGQTEFRNMFIYHDSELEIAAGTSLTLDKLRMFALNDSVSYAIINNTNDADNPTITVNEVSHVKRIDGRYWYPFSLPYDCDISQISALNGKSLGKYGTDWCIKYYNGEQRQKDGTSAAIGQVSQYWEKLGESEKLEAYKGYIIGLYCPTAEEAHQKSVHFAPARQSVYTETGESKTTDVHNWPDNLEAEARHHGWNFTGSPYISLFGVNASGDGLFNDQLKMGYTDKLTGEQLDKEHVYLSIPDGKDTRTYTQVLASATTVEPFTAYFVQTIDPNDGMGQTLHLTYQKARRTFPGEEPNPTLAPRRAAERDAVLFAEINLTDNAAGGQDTYLRDNTGVLVSDRFSADYEIGDDLTKMYAAAGKPQLYTMAGNEKMAYNALPDGLAHNLPLGIYVPKAGEYTLSLNRHASRLENAEAVYLLHSGIIVADLLLSDYTILATAKGEQTGYMLDIRRATKVVTGTEQVATDEPYAIMCDGQLTIGNLPTASDVAIYDALGRLVWSEQQATTPVVADLPQTGVYMVLITSGEQQYVLKSLNR